MTVTRRYRFCASHRLHLPSLTEAENYELYGKCNNPWGHGHNYTVDVSVRGPVDERTGRVADLASLDSVVRRSILEPMDHHNFNTDIEPFDRVVPTTENIGAEMLRRLNDNWREAFPDGPVLERIRVTETARNTFEFANEAK